MNDYLSFKKMITPLIIQIAFWIGVLVSVVMGFVTMGEQGFLPGLFLIILGPLAVRIYCELIIIIFSINETLRETHNLLRDRKDTDPS